MKSCKLPSLVTAVSHCQVALVLLTSTYHPETLSSAHWVDIPMSEFRNPYTISNINAAYKIKINPFHYHYLRGSTSNKTSLKHSSHCINFLVAVTTNGYVLPEEFKGYGHYANDNYFFVGTESNLMKFLDSSANIRKLMRIKYKFLAKVTYSGRFDQSLTSVGLYTAGVCMNIQLLVNNKNAAKPPLTLHQVNKVVLSQFKNAIINGVHLSGAVINSSFIIWTNSKGEVTGGMYHAILKTLATHFNFTYDLTTQRRGTGRQLENGKWTDLMADLLYNEKDFVSLMAPEESRHGLIDVTTYKHVVNVVFYTHRPKASINWASLVFPFELLVWLILLIVFIIIVAVIYTEQSFSKLKYKINNHEPLFHAFMIPFSALVDQDHKIPRSARTISITWFLSIFILSTFYKDELFGYITHPQPESVPQTFKELHEHKDYRIFFHYIASTPSIYFEHTENPLHRALYSRFERFPNGQQCMINVALSERSVCMGLHNQLGAALASNLSINEKFQPLILGKEKLLPIFVGFGLPLHSVYTSPFDYFAAAIRESGIVGEWYQESLAFLRSHGKAWLREQRESQLYTNIVKLAGKVGRSANALNLYNFAAAFGLLGVGVLIAISSFFLEEEARLLWYGYDLVIKLVCKNYVIDLTKFQRKPRKFRW